MKLKGSSILSREQVNLLKKTRLNFLWFPKRFERLYTKCYRNEAADEFHYRGIIILILYVYLASGISQVLPDDQVIPWISLYGWVGVIIFSVWVMSFVKRFNPWFDYYVCFGSILSVAISFILVNGLEQVQNTVLFHTAMMYAVIIIYGFVGLRFYTALIAGWLGGLIGLIVSNHMNTTIDWTLLNRTYTFSSFLGMSMAYFIDRQHRENFLKNCIIEHNHLELIQQAQQLSKLSQIDALTGLANRRYLDEILQNEWERAIRYTKPITAMMIDIDYFKFYNDALGHVQGDECLKRIAFMLNSATSNQQDVLVARYGGEEFLLIFPQTNEQQAKQWAEQLIKSMHQLALPHPSSPISACVTLSIGVATLIPSYEESISEFITSTDHALYLAKHRGRDQYQIAMSQEVPPLAIAK
ncbi:GGDEF domain-containing protein [Acinetobacter sp. ANC 4641]|uniref:GGDEF domain-containing protein n=1 Tax=Acinetobacter sp. ANC 4641 TaxID=2529847 RepID=UPI001040D70C|nr:GGDEF domain-containing protein [Acinetobacter sp. ANC 4641]TCB13678.1 GGDEF domain-containing protein [Acinetobacter sp. ANC 4641]